MEDEIKVDVKETLCEVRFIGNCSCGFQLRRQEKSHNSLDVR